mmetsp:Transcript_44966/g.95869  ORF Transcript_44966/g.95869 Transcript_44966/m.95869 type:complete len:240 (-) Transcript_44966:86-805(-)
MARWYRRTCRQGHTRRRSNRGSPPNQHLRRNQHRHPGGHPQGAAWRTRRTRWTFGGRVQHTLRRKLLRHRNNSRSTVWHSRSGAWLRGGGRHCTHNPSQTRRWCSAMSSRASSRPRNPCWCNRPMSICRQSRHDQSCEARALSRPSPPHVRPAGRGHSALRSPRKLSHDPPHRMSQGKCYPTRLGPGWLPHQLPRTPASLPPPHLRSLHLSNPPLWNLRLWNLRLPGPRLRNPRRSWRT